MQTEGLTADVRYSTRVHFSFRPRRARGPAAFVLSAAHHAAASGACAISAATAHSGSSPEGRDRVAYALVAAAFASEHCGLPHFGNGGTRFKPAGRGDPGRALAHRTGQWLAGGTGLGSQTCRGGPSTRGGRAKFAARCYRRDIGSRSRHRATRCDQGARSPAGHQTCALHTRPSAGSNRDRKICRHPSKARHCLDRRRA